MMRRTQQVAIYLNYLAKYCLLGVGVSDERRQNVDESINRVLP